MLMNQARKHKHLNNLYYYNYCFFSLSGTFRNVNEIIYANSVGYLFIFFIIKTGA